MAFFQRFKFRTATWFRDNVSSLALFNEFTAIVNMYDKVYKSCAPAALVGLLLKLESIYYEDDTKYPELLDVYIKGHHKAVAEGRLQESHHKNGWALEAGLDKVLSLRALGRRPSFLPDNAPRVDIIICYCAERLIWLKSFNKVPWRDVDRSAAMRAHVALRIYHKCGAPGKAEREAERRRLVKEWGLFFRAVVVRYVDDVYRADDCSAYLAYAVDRYDSLPEFSVFLHADAPEHVPNLELLTDTVFAAARGYIPTDLGFLHLAHNYVRHELGCSEGPKKNECENDRADDFQFPLLWKAVFGSSIAPSMAAGDVAAYCCVQFMVRAERIRLRPRSFYDRALTYFAGPQSYYNLFPTGKVVRGADTLGRTPCQLAMYIWHVVFGEEPRLPRRQNDPRVPLFMKMSNIEVEVLTEEAVSPEDEEMAPLIAHNHAVEAGPHSIASRLDRLFAE